MIIIYNLNSMKFAIVLIALINLAALVLSRKHKKNGKSLRNPSPDLCGPGTTEYNKLCDYVICGSQCKEGMECVFGNKGQMVCKIKPFGACMKNSQCKDTYFCEKGQCRSLPGLFTTQKDLGIADDL